jgi:long-subunit fatty acid transport protein
MCSQPENPDYDAEIQMVARGLLVPGVQVGVLVIPTSSLRLGLAWEKGYDIDQTADLEVRLPRAAAFQDAHVAPKDPKGRVRMRLPMELRGGVEYRYEDSLRAEAALVWEPWSVHQTIDVDASNVVMRDVAALGDYRFGAMSIERHFQDTYSARFGVESSGEIAPGQRMSGRLGVTYEPSAVPDEYLTAMTVDLDRVIVSAGAGYERGPFTFEVLYAYVHMAERTITDSKVTQLNGTRPPWSGRTPIGNGTYDGSAHIVGLGVSMRLGSDGT